MKKKVVGVILGSGVGNRFGNSTPKQFIKLAGKTVIEHTVSVFESCSLIDEIIVVVRHEYIDKVWGFAQQNQWQKVSKVIAGGNERFDSTHSAIASLEEYDENTNVLFHDAVRPLVTHDILARCVEALAYFSAVDVVIPSNDTLVTVHDNGSISQIPDRSTMRRGQTPQAFHLGVIRQAYQKLAKLAHKQFTCDCGVVRAMLPHIEVTTVLGAEENIKITVPLDLFLAEKLIQTSTINLPIDHLSSIELSELKQKHIVVIGGTSGIGESLVNLLKQYDVQVSFTGLSKGVDVADLSSVSDFLKEAQLTSDIFAVVNTTGILIKKPLALMSEQEIVSSIDTNYLGAINIAKAAYPYLKKSQGMLINFTSSSYTRGRSFYSLYSSAKSAIVNLTQALAEEWGDEGIKVNCINPERTLTPMRIKNFGHEPVETLLTAEKVAERCLMTLLSSQTGIIVDVTREN